MTRIDVAPVALPIRTTCPYCGVGCGVVVEGTGRARRLAGDSSHPANQGRLCSKGAALGETTGLTGRLLKPTLHGIDVGWEQALQHVADGFQRIIRQHGPDAVAFYVSGQLLTEDYYIANKLMKGFIGSANIDTNSRLCMSSAVAAHKRAFGEDLVPVQYQDLELADLIVLVGSNTAWCHPVMYQRIVREKERRPGLKLVVIDPRRTPTCELSDLHLPVRAGTDVWLFNGLLAYLHAQGVQDHAFVRDHTANLDSALTVASESAGTIEQVADRCGIQRWALEEFYDLFSRTARVVTAFSQGVNQSSAGTDKANSIINCHLYTGRIGRPGSGPFSITGQPNAMGGREVGGLSNMLAAHMDLENPSHRALVQRFWGSPRIAERPGLKAVELFEAIHQQRVRAVWIAATNPVVSMPDADRVRAALARCELVVVSDCVSDTDTMRLAHVALPAAAWGEKNGTVTNSERCISRQRPFLPLPGEVRPDWWMFCEVARRMGYGHAFNHRNAYEIFLEHARLSRTGNDGDRAFDLGRLGDLSEQEYESLVPTNWPLASQRLFEDGRFFHVDRRARFVATTPHDPVHAPDENFPLVLNTGRIRDQWHTMTRTGRAPRLNTHLPEPYIDMHEQDALLLGIRAPQLARISTRWGSLVGRLRTSGDMPRGMVFVPIHWSDVFCSDARVGALVNPVVDPVSGEPEFKHTPANVVPFEVDWYGFILSRSPLRVDDLTWWSCLQGDGFNRYEVAGRGRPADWGVWARQRLAAPTVDVDWLEYSDDSAGVYRAAHLVDDGVQSCLFVSARTDLPSRSWLASLFQRRRLGDADRAGLLAGQAANAADGGAPVCTCFGVGRNTICSSIRERGLTTTVQIGKLLRAGTNCGSCLPEIRALLTVEGETRRSLHSLP
jgi:assimilatory nitrate reductase catalytic subunit